MAFQKISGKMTYVKYKESKAGDVLAEGIYLGHRQGQYGIQHQVKTDSGEIVVLNSSGQLNWQLENLVQVGDCIQVTYKGTILLTTGKMKGKESHQFELAVDKSRSQTGSTSALESDEQDDDASAAEATQYRRSNVLSKAEQDEDEDSDSETSSETPAKSGSSVLDKYRRKA